jgi:2-keto-4-pentenoate hydratase/2-oxohepta-3-ene-1,7-dioic acid hydratase in catechol pathway
VRTGSAPQDGLVSIAADGEVTWGVLRDSTIAAADGIADAPRTMLDLLRSPDREEWIRRAADGAQVRAMDEARLLAPIPRPPTDVIAIGVNYRAHLTEAETRTGIAETTKAPVVFGRRRRA